MTATSLCNDTRRFDLDFLDDDELQLVCDEAVVKLPRDAADRKGGENISNRCCREGKKYNTIGRTPKEKTVGVSQKCL